MDIFSIFNINESFLIQLILLYSLYNITTSVNLYNVLMYVIVIIFIFGVYLSFYNMEMFTAFLWLTEVVVLLVCLFLLFTVSPSGKTQSLNKNVFEYKNIAVFIVSVFNSYGYTTWYSSDNNYNLAIEIYLYDDYYEALYNNIMNDLYGLYIGFYFINSVEFILVTLLLLIGSVVAVKLNKFLIIGKIKAYPTYFSLFNFVKETFNFLFLRKQNLTDQQNGYSSTRVFKKK